MLKVKLGDGGEVWIEFNEVWPIRATSLRYNAKAVTVCRLVSIVDRFLEHARVCYFLNGGDEEVYLSYADWIYPDNGEGQATGKAFTSRKDQHDPLTGRKLALQRALAATCLDETDRLRIWVAFFARELEEERRKRPAYTFPNTLLWEYYDARTGQISALPTAQGKSGISAPVSAGEIGPAPDTQKPRADRGLAFWPVF